MAKTVLLRRVVSVAFAFGVLGVAAPVLAQKSVRLATAVPASSTIIFHTNQMIYAMDSAGGNVTQITFDQGGAWDHVALSPDRMRVVANYYVNGRSKLRVFDLAAGTEAALLPQFYDAGLGGVDWDVSGNIYFAGIQALPFPAGTKVPQQVMANGGANDVYQVRYDGTGLRRLTRTGDRAEADVSVSADGTRIAYRASVLTPALHGDSEIWVGAAAGSARVLVYLSKDETRTVHDPELSPDGTELVFSMVNPDAHNFPATINTAHDLWRLRLNGTAPTRITAQGPISILPDWVGTKIVYLLLEDNAAPIADFFGAVVMNADGSNAVRISNAANIPKFIN